MPSILIIKMNSIKNANLDSINFDVRCAPIGYETDFYNRMKNDIKKFVTNLSTKHRLNSKCQLGKNLNTADHYYVSMILDRMIENARENENEYYSRNSKKEGNYPANWDLMNHEGNYWHRKKYKNYILNDFDEIFEFVTDDLQYWL